MGEGTEVISGTMVGKKRGEIKRKTVIGLKVGSVSREG